MNAGLLFSVPFCALVFFSLVLSYLMPWDLCGLRHPPHGLLHLPVLCSQTAVSILIGRRASSSTRPLSPNSDD